MFYSNKTSILVSDEENSSRSKINSFMRILNLQRIVFLMCIVSSGEITCGMKDNKEEELKDKIEDKITVIKLGSNIKEQSRFEYKVTFLGDTKVGKTQIINKHIDSRFNDKSDPTIGVDFRSHCSPSTINGGNSKTIKLSIRDTAGQKKFKGLLPNCIKVAHAIILVYDVTQKESFNNIKEDWLGFAKYYNPDAAYFLVGNKTDIECKEKVQTDEAKEFAENNKMRFFEVSAKKNTNIDELFKDIVKECLIKDKDAIQNNKCCICCRCCPCNKENKKKLLVKQ